MLDVDAQHVPNAYRHKLLLCHADQHVVWRGKHVAAQPAELIDVLRGAGRESIRLAA